ncbi:MAG: hypothetical protein JSW19_00405 [Candidatus Bathyarchaeota archaeon]|nr:MAG: hypothetical protein JSW19_00405 [Candidatus Bathyarchaeota archaeon]
MQLEITLGLYYCWGKAKKMDPSLIEALGQIFVGLKHIGNGVAYLITFSVNSLGLSASQELIKLATILILLSVVWKLGSKITSLVFWFLILAQFMSLANPS